MAFNLFFSHFFSLEIMKTKVIQPKLSNSCLMTYTTHFKHACVCTCVYMHTQKHVYEG